MQSVFRDNILDAKVALVTGGGSGICLGIAEALMGHGVRGVIVSRNPDRINAACTQLTQKTGRPCLPAPADVRDPAAIEAAMNLAIQNFGRLDIVVNGAAGNFLTPAAELSYNGFKTIIDIDTIGTFNVSKAAFNRYLRDHGGCIINISATLHYGATPGQVHAAAAKAAVDSITRSLALEWGCYGIRVNGIAPGPIAETEGIRRLLPGDQTAQMARAIPIGRLGTIREVAQVAVFLASDASSLIHGETIVADGGGWLSHSSWARTP